MLRRKLTVNTTRKKSKHKIIITIILLILIALLCIFFIFNLNFNANYFINPVVSLTVGNNSKIEKLLKSENFYYKEIIKESKDYAEVLLENDVKVIFSLSKDIKQQISSLQLMLSRTTIDNRKLKVLDFRYNNPVASFN